MHAENKCKKERGRWGAGEKGSNHERQPGTKRGPEVPLPPTRMERKRKTNKKIPDPESQALLIQK